MALFKRVYNGIILTNSVGETLSLKTYDTNTEVVTLDTPLIPYHPGVLNVNVISIVEDDNGVVLASEDFNDQLKSWGTITNRKLNEVSQLLNTTDCVSSHTRIIQSNKGKKYVTYIFVYFKTVEINNIIKNLLESGVIITNE